MDSLYDEVCVSIQAGETQTHIAQRLGVSRQRIHQLKVEAEQRNYQPRPDNDPHALYRKIVEYVKSTGNHDRTAVAKVLGTSGEWVGKCIRRATEKGDL